MSRKGQTWQEILRHESFDERTWTLVQATLDAIFDPNTDRTTVARRLAIPVYYLDNLYDKQMRMIEAMTLLAEAIQKRGGLTERSTS